MIDEEPPVFLFCPSDLTVTLGASSSTKRVSWSEPFATDNTIGYMLSTNVTSGTRLGVGVTVVQYVAMDLFGNEETCVFTVTVLGKSQCRFLSTLGSLRSYAMPSVPNSG